jgi:hypothetical protein
MSRRRLTLTFVAGLLVSLALDASLATAAIVYMGPNEANTTLRQALAAMKGGDTLIIRDGTYRGRDNSIRVGTGGNDTLAPPSGSAGLYTIISYIRRRRSLPDVLSEGRKRSVR